MVFLKFLTSEILMTICEMNYDEVRFLI